MAIIDITPIVKRNDEALGEMLQWLMENVGQVVRKGAEQTFDTVVYEDDKLTKSHIDGIGWHMTVQTGKWPRDHESEVLLHVYDDLMATQARLTWQ